MQCPELLQVILTKRMRYAYLCLDINDSVLLNVLNTFPDTYGSFKQTITSINI